MLAKLLVPESLGRFGTILAQAIVFSQLASLGVGGYWVRRFAELGKQASSLIGPSIRLTTIATLLLWIAFVCLGLVQGMESGVLYALIGTQIAARAGRDLCAGAFQSEKHYSAYSLMQFWPYALRIVFILVGAIAWHHLTVPTDLLAFASAHFLYCVVMIVITGVFLSRFYNRQTLERAQALHFGFVPLIRGGWPFLSSTLMFTLYTQSSVIISGELLSHRDAADFMVASLFSGAGYMGISVIYQRYFQPRMFTLRIKDPEKFRQFFKIGFKFSILLGVLCLLSLWFAAEYVIAPVFGEEFVGASAILSILAGAVAVRCLNSHCSTMLVRAEDLAFRTRSQIGVTILIVPAMMAAAYGMGTRGIAACSLVYEICLLAQYFPRSRKAASFGGPS